MNIPELKEPTYAETYEFIKDKNNWEEFNEAVEPPDLLQGITVYNSYYNASICYMIHLHCTNVDTKGKVEVKSLQMTCMIENLSIHPADPNRISQAIIYDWRASENDKLPLKVPQLAALAADHYLRNIIWPGTPADQPILIINKSLEE